MTFPPELEEALKQGTAVLVAGSGCGALYDEPGWPARLEALIAALPPHGASAVRALLARDGLGQALTAARNRLGPQAATLVAGLSVRAERPPAVLTALAALPWRAVITTGFDDAWSRALSATGPAPVVLSAGEPLTPQGKRTLIHVLGRAVRPETLCLSPVDLSSRVLTTGLERLLRDLARAGSFVYVGFDPGDPDLEWLAGRLLGPSARERQHFALVPGMEIVDPGHFRATFNIRPFGFGGSLEAGLAALAGAAAETNGTIEDTGTGELQLGDLEETHERVTPPPVAPRSMVPPPVAPPPVGEPLRAQVERSMEEERWPEVAEGLGRLAELETDAAARAKLLHATALVRKDHLQDRSGAVVLLEGALQANPALVPAWDALEPLQRGGGDPAALCRSYARALTALGKTADRSLSLRLWSGLAEVSWRALGDHATAAAAFEVVRTLEPEDEGPERALASLYLKLGPAAADEAVAAHQALCARSPDDAEPYRVLERLWRDEPAPEKASWAAAVLGQLGQASRPSGLVTGLRPGTTVGSLGEPQWECLFHPDEDRVLSTLFTVLCPSLVALMAEPQKGLTPDGAESVAAVDPSATTPTRGDVGLGAGAFAAAALAHVAHVLDVQPPALFLADARRRPVSVRLRTGWPGVRPALIVDRRFAASAPEAELLFRLAHTVALLRPPWVLRLGAGAPAIADLGLRAALTLSGVEPEGRRDVQRLLEHLREARPDLAQEQIAALASELAHRPELPDLNRWLAAIELSAARAALVVTGDLDAAVSATNADAEGSTRLDAAERVKDLLAFAVSNDHFAVRAALGLDAPAPAARLTEQRL